MCVSLIFIRRVMQPSWGDEAPAGPTHQWTLAKARIVECHRIPICVPEWIVCFCFSLPIQAEWGDRDHASVDAILPLLRWEACQVNMALWFCTDIFFTIIDIFFFFLKISFFFLIFYFHTGRVGDNEDKRTAARTRRRLKKEAAAYYCSNEACLHFCSGKYGTLFCFLNFLLSYCFSYIFPSLSFFNVYYNYWCVCYFIQCLLCKIDIECGFLLVRVCFVVHVYILV